MQDCVNISPKTKIFWLIFPLIALCYAAKNNSSGGNFFQNITTLYSSSFSVTVTPKGDRKGDIPEKLEQNDDFMTEYFDS